MDLIKLGSKGSNVATIQSALDIKDDGIFRTETEKHIREYQLSKGLVSDGIVGVKTINILMSEYIRSMVDYLPASSLVSKRNTKVKYIVVHYTAGSSSSKGNAVKTRNGWLSTRRASADFVIDDETIVQVNPSLRNNYTWAVGDGKGRKGITNSNSISIEICSNRKSGTSFQIPNHEGWFFTDKELELAVKLIKALMLFFDIPISNVIRHYDASGKLCPGVVNWNDGMIYDKYGHTTKTYGNSSEWLKFKNRLK